MVDAIRFLDVATTNVARIIGVWVIVPALVQAFCAGTNWVDIVPAQL